MALNKFISEENNPLLLEVKEFMVFSTSVYSLGKRLCIDNILKNQNLAQDMPAV